MATGDEAVAAAPEARLRLDRWLWYARFYRSRTLAAAAAAGGRMRLNGNRIDKAHQPVRPGDVLTFPWGSGIRVVRVRALGNRRGPASEARLLYEDIGEPCVGGVGGQTSPVDAESAGSSRVEPEPCHPAGSRPAGAGRPGKAERRALERLLRRP